MDAPLLSQEMLAIDEGMRALTTALSAGDWKAVADTAGQIEASYILKQRLAPGQLEELHQALPSRFQEIDAGFHHTAGKLSHAAQERDRELAAFYFYKLVDSCGECHSVYARERFPGFREEANTGAHHHCLVD